MDPRIDTDAEPVFVLHDVEGKAIYTEPLSSVEEAEEVIEMFKTYNARSKRMKFEILVAYPLRKEK